VAELTEGEGLSNREAAEVLGVGKSTVQRDRKAVPNGTAEPSEQIELGAKAGPNGTPHVARATGENEWYTPPEYVEAARAEPPPPANAGGFSLASVRAYSYLDSGRGSYALVACLLAGRFSASGIVDNVYLHQRQAHAKGGSLIVLVLGDVEEG